MWRCNECGETFDEPSTTKTTFENYYGVGSMFQNHHNMSYLSCPSCGSEDIDEWDEEDEEEYEGLNEH